MRDGSGGGGGGDIKTLSVDNLITVLQVMLQYFFQHRCQGRAGPKTLPSPSSHIRETARGSNTLNHNKTSTKTRSGLKKNVTIVNIPNFFFCELTYTLIE